MTKDKEFDALWIAFKALRSLDALAQQRAIHWLSSRFAADEFARAKGNTRGVADGN